MYCNKNCIGCSVSSRARRFYCEEYLQNLRPIFCLFVYYITWRDDYVHKTVSYLYRPAKWPRACYTSVHCSFRDSVNTACMEPCHFWQIALSPWVEVKTPCFGRRRYSRLFLAIDGLLVLIVFCTCLGLVSSENTLHNDRHCVSCRPYLSNGRAYGTVVVCRRPSSVTDVLWLSVKFSFGKTFSLHV